MKTLARLKKDKTRRLRWRQEVAEHNLQFFWRVWSDRPVPLWFWRTWWVILNRISGSPNRLLPATESYISSRVTLQIPQLQTILQNEALGAWTLDVKTLELVWGRLWQDRPTSILERGAGVSTLLFALYANEASSATRVHQVFSIEQDFDVKTRVEERLAQHGLANLASIFHLPITEQGAYEIDRCGLRKALAGTNIDWLFIDGPSGPPGCRIWTLPELMRLCLPGTRWFLDDAFRDADFVILADWGRITGIEIDGIYPCEKGLATGRIR